MFLLYKIKYCNWKCEEFLLVCLILGDGVVFVLGLLFLLLFFLLVFVVEFLVFFEFEVELV